MEFKVELAGTRYKPHQVTALYLITGFTLLGTGAVTVLMAGADWVKKLFYKPLIDPQVLGLCALVFGIVVLLLSFFRNKWLQRPANNKTMRIANLLVAGSIAAVFLLSHWWLPGAICGVAALANLFAFFYEQKAGRKIYVLFDEQGIVLPPTSRRKQLDWHEVERVLLRHGIVTIDCVNNFLYQWNIGALPSDAAALEEFSAGRIEAAKHKRVAEW
jgi:hypothetical protein